MRRTGPATWALGLLAATLGGIQGDLNAADLALQCAVVDAATMQPKASFKKGERLLLAYSLNVPPEAADRQAFVKVGARAVISGIPIAYSIDDVEIALPNKTPTAVTPPLPSSGNKSGAQAATIPLDWPSGSITLRAKVAIEGVGKQSCSIDIAITD